MEKRFQPQEIWQANESAGRAEQGGSKSSRVRRPHKHALASSYVENKGTVAAARPRSVRPASSAKASAGVAKDQTLVNRLRKELQSAMKIAHRHRRRVFLELYAGTGK
eukprot:11343734-Karenia_brevis.AAC.1